MQQATSTLGHLGHGQFENGVTIVKERERMDKRRMRFETMGSKSDGLGPNWLQSRLRTFLVEGRAKSNGGLKKEERSHRRLHPWTHGRQFATDSPDNLTGRSHFDADMCKPASNTVTLWPIRGIASAPFEVKISVTTSVPLTRGLSSPRMHVFSVHLTERASSDSPCFNRASRHSDEPDGSVTEQASISHALTFSTSCQPRWGTPIPFVQR